MKGASLEEFVYPDGKINDLLGKLDASTVEIFFGTAFCYLDHHDTCVSNKDRTLLLKESHTCPPLII